MFCRQFSASLFPFQICGGTCKESERRKYYFKTGGGRITFSNKPIDFKTSHMHPTLDRFSGTDFQMFFAKERDKSDDASSSQCVMGTFQLYAGKTTTIYTYISST